MTPLPGDLAALYAHHAADGAVTYGAARALRWDELCARARGVAAALPTASGDGAEVVVICEDRTTFVTAVLAAWMRGHAVALPPNAQPETVRRLRSGALTVLHDRDGAPGIHVGADWPPADALPPAPVSLAGHVATLYTSGSTGEPLPCRKTASQLVGEARMLAETFALGRGARVLATVPPHHIYGLLYGVLLPAVSGGAFHAAPPLFGEDLARSLDADGADAVVTVPAHLYALAALPAGRLPAVARVFSSGAPLPAAVAAEVHARHGWSITEVFGSSETGGIAWRTSPPERPGPHAWRALPGVDARVGPDGRLRVSSPFLDPSVPAPLVTGDAAEEVPGGFVHLGRADGVLKVGAYRLSLVELEARVLAVPGVRDCAALASEAAGARGVEVRVAFVSDAATADDVRRALRGWLSPVTMPRVVRRVAALPRESSGKLRREALVALLARSGEADR